MYNSRFVPNDLDNESFFKVKTLFQIVIPKNEVSLQVLKNDEKVLVLFASSKGEEEENTSLEPKYEVIYFDREGILNLKSNYFLKDLVSLESCFMRNDATKAKAPIEEISPRKIREINKINIGETKNLELSNLGISC